MKWSRSRAGCTVASGRSDASRNNSSASRFAVTQSRSSRRSRRPLIRRSEPSSRKRKIRDPAADPFLSFAEKECSIPILRNANRAKCRHVEGIADIGQQEHARPAPDFKCACHECDADCQDQHQPRKPPGSPHQVSAQPRPPPRCSKLRSLVNRMRCRHGRRLRCLRTRALLLPSVHSTANPICLLQVSDRILGVGELASPSQPIAPAAGRHAERSATYPAPGGGQPLNPAH